MKTFSKIIGSPKAKECRNLRLIVLGCEPKPPYGPNENTALLLLDLLCAALSEYRRRSVNAHRTYTADAFVWRISLSVYNVQLGEFPGSAQEWDAHDGIIIPGSFSSVHDSDLWIQRLQHVIQQEIVREKRRSLAICFGHQLFAHSFPDGVVDRVPSGPRAGRCTTLLTAEANVLYERDRSTVAVDFYFSHGDMVTALPSTAVCLGGSSAVPIEMAAYFGSSEEAEALRGDSARRATVENDGLFNGPRYRPFALTFQAHPEYAKGTKTMDAVMDAMAVHFSFESMRTLAAKQDARSAFTTVHNNSVDTICKACELLRWFAPES
jgi:GMP synthase-like glutamine amidotransferase